MDESTKKIIWITWKDHLRSRTLADKIAAVYVAIEATGPRLVRYMRSAWETYCVIRIHNPRVLICQNPSLVLCVFCILCRRLFGVQKIVIDAHNAGIFPAEGRSRFLGWFARFCIRNADLVIVTNRGLQLFCDELGGFSFVLPDALPPEFHDRPTRSPNTDYSKWNVVAICSGGIDEPIDQILEAAEMLEGDADFQITGSSARVMQRVSRGLPTNVVLTGYLSNSNYVRLIQNAWCILDLTLREDCLVCGAYEAISAAVPVVLSNTSANRELFSDAAVFSDNRSTSIVDAIRSVAIDYDDVRGGIERFRVSYSIEWSKQCAKLIDWLVS